MTCAILPLPLIRLFLAAALTAAFFAYSVHAEDASPARTETFTLPTEAPNNRHLEFAVRLPAVFSPERARTSRVLVVFGGRNWEARRTLSTYDFNDFADRHNVILLAPGFRDDDYWQPEAWSGQALTQALARIREQYYIPDRPVFLYGYSAGGQCANLFYAWMPEKVAAWGAHACGVFFDPAKQFTSPTPPADAAVRDAEIVKTSEAVLQPRPAPALVTCGVEDEPRRAISRHFLYAYREAGGEAIGRDYPGGHELIPDPVKLAGEFFASLLTAPDAPPAFVGDDDTGRYHPAGSRAVDRIPEELRSQFRTEAIARTWQRPATGE